MKKRLAVAVLVALPAFPLGAGADPVTVTQGTYANEAAAACSIWVEPSGAEYEWTQVCGVQADGDGDGDVDFTVGFIRTDICDVEDPTQPAFCSSGQQIRYESIARDDFTIDMYGGTAGLHTGLGGCDLAMDWAATSEASSTVSDEIPPRIEPVVEPPSASVTVRKDTVSYVERRASMSGIVCPVAGVTGAPRVSYLLTAQLMERSLTVVVDPTA